MNKTGLIEVVTERLGDKRIASHAIEAVVDVVIRTVAAGEKVAITGFGVFERQERAARLARNPLTGVAVKVKKTSVPRFRPGKDFKALVNGTKKLPKVSATTGRGATASAAAAPVKRAAAASAGRSRPVAASTGSRAAVKKEPDPARQAVTNKASGAKKTATTKAAEAAPAKASKAAPAKAAPAKAAKSAPAKAAKSAPAKSAKAAPAKAAKTSSKTASSKTTRSKTTPAQTTPAKTAASKTAKPPAKVGKGPTAEDASARSRQSKVADAAPSKKVVSDATAAGKNAPKRAPRAAKKG